MHSTPLAVAAELFLPSPLLALAFFGGQFSRAVISVMNIFAG
jgi:hypothetical protein